MEEKKKIGNAKLLVIAIVLILVVIIGTTYAWLSITKNSAIINKITAGNLELTLDDTTSEGIKLIKEVPRSYRQGMTTKEYTFRLANKSSTSSYTLSLKDLDTYTNDNNEEVTITDADRLADSKIRYILLKDGEEATASKSKILTDRVIDAGTIEKGKTITYSLRIWIDSKAGDDKTENEVMGKVFNAQLSLEATQTTSQKTIDFQVGDYVSMIPTSTNYTVSSNMTGNSSDQTLNPSELNLWRVINVNDDKTADIVSEYASSTYIHFNGKTAYLNYIGTLNQIASQYTNSKYTIGSRYMGYNGQTEVITDLSSISPNSPTFGNTSSETSSSDETKGAGDLLYERDINLVENVYGELRAPIAGAIGSYSTDYWIASREFDTSGGLYYRIRYINSNYSSTLSSYWVYGYYGNLTHDSNVAARIRPIVVLKSGLVPTGTGTSDDPYVLE